MLRAVPTDPEPCDPRAPVQSPWGPELGVSPRGPKASLAGLRLGAWVVSTIRPNAGPSLAVRVV